jgi:uncharacterized protein YjbI with pentapeptide repeats
MANPGHLAELKKGVAEWNTWRRRNLAVVPDLGRADLSWANLREADLSRADLSRAHLSWVNLTGADLSRAHLSAADLSGANLSAARLSETVFGNTNLKDVQGLDTCNHFGPSILDHRTLSKSGPLPLSFLRGCGLPDLYIEPSMLNQPFEFYSCFISYSTQDQVFAERLYADLQMSDS